MPVSYANIKKIAAEMGAVLCGIASADSFSDAPEGFHPLDVLPECRSVIVLAAQFSNEAISDMDAYTTERNQISDRMNEMAVELSGKLQEMGLRSVPIFALGPCSMGADGRIHGQVSLKHAAVLAGMGTIGKNSLLINDRFGNMIWLSAVLTTAELDADPLANYEGCIPDCTLCIDHCPVQAMHQEPLNQMTCYNHAFKTEDGNQRLLCCTCRIICPNYLGLH